MPTRLHAAIIEDALRATEARLGLSFTVIDKQGAFHTPAGMILFSQWRQSHKKNPVCECGFDRRCIEHCRYAMEEKCDRTSRGFIETCWKGVTEIVIPIRRGEELLGMFYAGAWRKKGALPPSGLPRNFHTVFAALPEWDESDGQSLVVMLELLVDGIVRRLDELAYTPTSEATRAGRIRDFVRRHAAGQVGIEDLAVDLGLSRSSTSRLLQQYFGCGLIKLLHQERIQRAQALLAGSTETIAAIAVKAGFADEFHFSKVFKKTQGISPGKFRSRSIGQ